MIRGQRLIITGGHLKESGGPKHLTATTLRFPALLIINGLL